MYGVTWFNDREKMINSVLLIGGHRGTPLRRERDKDLSVMPIVDKIVYWASAQSAGKKLLLKQTVLIGTFSERLPATGPTLHLLQVSGNWDFLCGELGLWPVCGQHKQNCTQWDDSVARLDCSNIHEGVNKHLQRKKRQGNDCLSSLMCFKFT